jgi:hypothetical protein
MRQDAFAEKKQAAFIEWTAKTDKVPKHAQLSHPQPGRTGYTVHVEGCAETLARRHRTAAGQRHPDVS